MVYRIGSFNLRNLGLTAMGKSSARRLDKIAEIIRGEEFDIVALQEILSEGKVFTSSEFVKKSILMELGPNWDFCWADAGSKIDMRGEGYAFIWNNKRFRLAESISATGKRVFKPRIYKQYKVDYKSGQKELVRNPYYARFETINGFAEIRLINTHIMYSKGKDRNEEMVNLSEMNMRRKELDVLVKNIYAKEADRRYGNNRATYTILLGDYNLNLNRAWTREPYLQEIIEINDGNVCKRIITVQDELTTLKSRSRLKPDEEVRGYANNYDHFSYDEAQFEGVQVKYKKIDSVRKYCGDDFERHRNEISDHVPISMEIVL